MKLLNAIKLPEVKGITDLDHASTTILHAKIIKSKPFLKNLYIDFYKMFKKSIEDEVDGKTYVELGSGGGFIKEINPMVITSDIIKLPDVDMVLNTEAMPFCSNSIDAFFMIDTLHHINKPRCFFDEANRCLKKMGKIIMIEPANSLWGRFVYQNFHHEGFDPSAGWDLEETGPMSGTNGAIPWIVLSRDRKIFEKEYPSLKINEFQYMIPFRYLLSGGVSFRQLLPSFTYRIVKFLEIIISPLNRILGMFTRIEIQKTEY